MKTIWTKDQDEYAGEDLDRWSGLPPDSMWAKWLGGLVVPALVLWPALGAMLTKSAVLWGQNHSRMQLRGLDAVLLGCVLLCLALFLHVHFFWGNSRRLLPFHDAGKIVALSGFCIALVWLVLRLFNDVFA